MSAAPERPDPSRHPARRSRRRHARRRDPGRAVRRRDVTGTLAFHVSASWSIATRRSPTSPPAHPTRSRSAPCCSRWWTPTATRGSRSTRHPIDRRAVPQRHPGDASDNGTAAPTDSRFQFTFDPGPGEDDDLRCAHRLDRAAGGTSPTVGRRSPADPDPRPAADSAPYDGPQQQDRSLERFPLPDDTRAARCRHARRCATTRAPSRRTRCRPATLTSGRSRPPSSPSDGAPDDLASRAATIRTTTA